MRLTKLAALMASSISCLYLTQCTTPAHLAQPSQNAEPKKIGNLVYPETRTHQEQKDNFLQGEYGRPSGYVNTAGVGETPSNTPRPDDGIDHYAKEVIVDKYRWLEEIDVINPEYAKETTADRERNFTGSHFENDIPNGQLDNRAVASLQVVPERQSSEVNDWVEAQNKVTFEYIQAVPYYQDIVKNINSLMGSRHSIRRATKENVGEIHYFRHEDGYGRIVYTDLLGKEHELVNEKDLSDDGTKVIAGGDIYVSDKGTYIAYFVKTGNSDSDLTELRVIKTKTGEEVKRLTNAWPADDGGVTWLDDESFYYLGKSVHWNVWNIMRHHVNANHFNDPIVVSSSYLRDTPTWGRIVDFILLGDSKRYMQISADIANGTDYIFDLQTKKMYRLHSPAFWNKVSASRELFDATVLASFVDLDEKTLDVYFVSGENTQKGEIIKSNLKNLKKREVVVPHFGAYDRMLSAVRNGEGNGEFLIRYIKDAAEKVVLVSADGKTVKDLTPSIAGYVSHLSLYKDKDTKANLASFRFSNVITPRTVYKYDLDKGEFTDVRRRDLFPFVTEDYEVKHVMYPSKDGTMIPMVISHKKGLKLDGKNPTVLYGYGGFSSRHEHWFNFPPAAWMEHGGVWVTAHLRGGDEYGEEWHQAGKRLNKMSVFEDFESAADYLAAQGYASSDYLAISGTSNGGLLVGAAMTLNPSKYRVAIPDVGVMDMLRYPDMSHYHTDWRPEFGTAYDDKKMFDLLKSYSPYHNIKEGVCYPSTLVTTSKRDDRVVPSHSYKFTAELQGKQSCDNPVLLYAAQTQGHHPSTWQDRLNLYHLTTAFRLHEMGIKELPKLPERPTVEALKGEKWLQEEAKEAAKKQAAIEKRIQERQQGVSK